LFVRKAENLAREGDFIPNAQLFTSFPFRFPFWGEMVSNLQAVSPILSSAEKNILSHGKYASLNENQGRMRDKTTRI